MSKQEDGNEDTGTNVPQDEAPPAKYGLADWSVKAQARLDALAWNERLRKLETQQSAKSDTNTQSDAGQDDRIAELTKRSKEAESREAKLKKDNQRIKAELGALKGQVGASFAIRPGSTKAIESSKDDDDGVVTWEEDLGHEVPTNHVAPMTR